MNWCVSYFNMIKVNWVVLFVSIFDMFLEEQENVRLCCLKLSGVNFWID